MCETDLRPEAYVVACLLHGEWERGLAVMEELGGHAGYAPALANAALSRLAARDLDGAERLARRAVDLSPGSVPALRAVGSVLLVRKSWAEAESYLLRAGDLGPQDGGARQVLVRLYLAWDRPAAAVPHLAALLEGARDESALDLLKRVRKAAQGAIPAGDPAHEELRKLAARLHGESAARPETLTLCLIARNEARNLRRVIESVRGVASEIVVVDTGSTDETVKLARKLGARVDHFPWRYDFAAARNHSLSLATGDWVLVMDADDELSRESAAVLRGWLAQPAEQVEVVGLYRHYAYPGKRRAGLTVQPRLFRGGRGLRYESPVHERLVRPDGSAASAEHVLNAVMVHHGIDGTATAAGRQERNLGILKPYLEQHPEDARGQFYAGTIHLEREEWAAAVEPLRRAVALAPADADFAAKAHGCLGYALLQAGRPLDAEAALRRGLEAFPHYPDLHYALGLTLDSLGRLEEAVDAHEAALRGCYGPSLNWHDWSSREDRPHIALADLRLALGDPEAALAHVDAAESFTGSSALYADLRGAILSSLQEQEAAQAAREAQLESLRARVAGGEASAAADLVARLLGSGRAEEAERVLGVLPPGPEADLARAAWLLATGRAAEALLLFEGLDSPAAASGHAQALEALDRLDAAEAVLRPHADSLAAEYGRFLLRRERWSEAAAWLQRAVDREPQAWGVWLDLGRALLESGNTQAGIQCLQRATSLSSGSVEVRRALGRARELLARRAAERRQLSGVAG